MNDKEILGKWADEGYFVKEYADHVVTVCYKDSGVKELAAFNQTAVTRDQLQAVCERHHARLAMPEGVAQ